ncbi:MAG: hypothetical protein AB1816_18260, partial [Bacillota bacterium]
MEAFAFGCVERALFRDHYVRGEPLAECEHRHLPLFHSPDEYGVVEGPPRRTDLPVRSRRY